jgi:hypothetical protein
MVKNTAQIKEHRATTTITPIISVPGLPLGKIVSGMNCSAIQPRTQNTQRKEPNIASDTPHDFTKDFASGSSLPSAFKIFLIKFKIFIYIILIHPTIFPSIVILPFTFALPVLFANFAVQVAHATSTTLERAFNHRVWLTQVKLFKFLEFFVAHDNNLQYLFIESIKK